MHGIARYVVGLLTHLNFSDFDWQTIVLVSKRSPLFEQQWPENVKLVTCSSKWIGLSEQIELPSLLRCHHVDVFHSPSFVAPFFASCQMVITIHDLNHVALPHFYTPFHDLYYRAVVRRIAEQAAKIITVSDYSRKELIRNWRLDPDRVVVTYNGIDEVYQPEIDPEYQVYVRELYGLPAEYIFSLSANKLHKNMHQLVRAYCFSSIEIPLVLTCSFNQQLIDIAESYGKKHRIYFAEFIEDHHLPALYSSAKLFVYPSLFEGFGLPPLEALACGVLSVVANSTSLPEVMGEYAIYVDPNDFQDISRGLERGLSDEEMQKRAASQGPKYVQGFRWQNTAQQTAEVYRSLVRGYHEDWHKRQVFAR